MKLLEPYAVNRRTAEGLKTETVYIGRPGVFGNPFVIGRDGSREEVIAKFEAYARRQPALMTLIRNLPADAVLGCFCKPLACHGDVIVKLWKEMHP